MITTILIEHPWLSPAALTLLLVVGPFAGAWLSTRRGLAWALTCASLVPVALLTLVPVDRQLYSRCEVAWSVPTIARVELAANVVLFVAPVLLAAVATRSPALALAFGTGLSAAVEAVQALLPALGRSCSTNDWLANSVGSVIGAVLGLLALHLAREWRHVRQPAQDLHTS
ncbi:VanZ family protein [Nocardioides sp. cx-173]|uniref:VanZ family protein n=1 Tax=Nocardioides sp. cx-173 TaxID=2898796 RepID=UPI001E558A26|nr:VanZ family protein [Nocardioides sp. cx-173]MCD4525927.1 VanZ family protein [Nocardioides sp. cx-173]UGB40078.1 VanZ family protein [Nocardioides sp. cx-173]